MKASGVLSRSTPRYCLPMVYIIVYSRRVDIN